MSIPGFFAKQPVLVNLLMLAILVGGIFVLKNMPMEQNPSIDMDAALIIVPYAGASPEEIEKLITLPIEDQLKGLKDVDFMNANSSEGRAVFYIQYEVGLEDFNQTLIDLKEEVDKVKPELPKDARDDLFVLKLNTSELWPVVSISMGGDYSAEGMNQISDTLKEELLDIEHIADVDVGGLLDRLVVVEADRSKLEASNISLAALTEILSAANIMLPSGRLKMGRQEFIVRAMGEIDTPKQIENLVVSSSQDGQTIRVKDVANVKDTFEEDPILSRVNGKQSVYIRIFMKKNGSIVDVADNVKKLIDDFDKRIPNLAIQIREDNSKEVKDSIDALVNNAGTGLILVVILMTAAIGFRSAILAVIGIPFAFLTAFIFLGATGGTINTLSLFAFILVLGMVVDDAIIIIENVYRHLEEGKTPLRAAIDGTEQVMWPVIAAILTSVAVFLPLLMIKSVIGKFLAVLPIVVSLALLGSLIESLIVLPSHLADFGKAPKKGKQTFGKKFFAVILGVYEKQIQAFLNHKYLVTLGTVVVTIAATMIAASTLRVEMFPTGVVSSETLLVRLPVGTKLEETDRVLKIIEKNTKDLVDKDVESVTCLTGLIIENHQWIRTTAGGMLIFDLKKKDFRRKNDEIRQHIRDKIKDIPEISSAYFATYQDGPPVGSPVELRLKGDNLDKLQSLSQMVEEFLKGIEGVSDINSSYELGKQEIRFIPDRVKMSAYGLSMTQLAILMRTAIEGLETTKFRDDRGNEVRVLLRYKESDRDDIDDLKNLVVNTRLGIKVPLSELGEFEIVRGASTINRRDNKRTITVSANVNKEIINSNEANKKVKEEYKDFNTRFAGYNLEFGGEAKEQAKSFKAILQSFIIALLLVYLILGTQFQSFTQPLVVMFTVPFSMLGVALGLIVMNLTFSIVAAISVVALAGVVVNDSLVMVDFINKSRAMGYARRKAIIIAGSRRMRPIILTTVTTVAGLIPMATGMAGSSESWQPMAICICWGLSFATFLTLFVIPCAYSILDDIVNWFRRKFNMRTTDEILAEKSKELYDETVAIDLESNKAEEASS